MAYVDDVEDEDLPNEALPTPFAHVRASLRGGERLLWLAVLRAAIVALDRGAHQQAAEVWGWVADESEHVGSFAFICCALDLTYSEWRRALLTMPRRPRGRPVVRRCAACQRKRWACPHGPEVTMVPPAPEPAPMQATA